MAEHSIQAEPVVHPVSNRRKVDHATNKRPSRSNPLWQRAEWSRLRTAVPVWSTPFDLQGLLLSEQVSLGAREAASRQCPLLCQEQ